MVDLLQRIQALAAAGNREAAMESLEAEFSRLEEARDHRSLIALSRAALDAAGVLAPPARLPLLLRRSLWLELLGEIDEEQSALDEARRLATELDSPLDRARVARRRGWLEVRTAQYQRAIETLSAGLALLGRHPDAGEEGNLLMILGNAEASLAHYDEALRAYERARSIARQRGDRRVEAGAEGNLGLVCQYLHRYEEALLHMEAQADLARAEGDAREEMIAQCNRANTQWELGRSEQALATYELAETLAARVGDRLAEATIAGNLGEALLDLGRRQAALSAFEHQRELAREIGDQRGAAYVEMGLGRLAQNHGEFARALAHFELALPAHEASGDQRGLALSRAGCGAALLAQGRLAAAGDTLKRALTEARATRGPGDEALALCRWAELDLLLGRDEAARQELEATHRLATLVRHRRLQGEALRALGYVQQARGETRAALRYHQDSLRVFEESSHRYEIVRSLVAVGAAAADAGDLAAARDALTRAVVEGQELDVPAGRALGQGHLAILHEGDAAKAIEEILANDARLSFRERLEARHLLARLTRDAAHLEVARRLLRDAGADLSAEDRTSFFEQVPLHREILSA